MTDLLLAPVLFILHDAPTFALEPGQPATIHDFSGFPQAFIQLSHPACGAPQVAKDLARQLRHSGWGLANPNVGSCYASEPG